MSEEKKSVYAIGAEDGLYMGPLMSLTVILIGASTYTPWLFLPAVICILMVPVLAYVRLYKSYKETSAAPSFSTIWLQGICMFFFGGLMMSVVIYVFLSWIVPDFMSHQIDLVINLYSSIKDPQATQMVKTFEMIKDDGLIPTALDTALEMLYFVVFSGSILSLIYSGIIRARRKRTTPPPYTN